MSKIFMYIKNFFSIIFSLILSFFYVDKKEENIKKEKEKTTSLNRNKKVKSIGTIRDDEESTKKLSNYTKEKDTRDILYNAKIDIQKLMIIQKNIINLEYQINITTNLEDLYSLQKELKKEKDKLEAIAIFYDKVDVDSKIIVDIKQIVSDSRKLVKEEEKNLDKKIYKEKNQVEEKEKLKEQIKKSQEQKETKQEENPVTEDILKIITIKEIIEKNFKIEVTNKKQQIEKESKPKEIEKQEIPKQEVIKKVEKKNTKITEKTKEEEKISKKESYITLVSRSEIVDKKTLEKNIKELKTKNKLKTLTAIAIIISKALTIAKKVNISQMLRISPQSAVSSVLATNNEIRRARSLNKKKVKKLKLEQVIKKVGLNPQTQIRAIMSNSISEIRKLKSELSKYEPTEELAAALNELNEIELEIMLQLQELENEKKLSNSKSR